jgi:hypothetical protein
MPPSGVIGLLKAPPPVVLGCEAVRGGLKTRQIRAALERQQTAASSCVKVESKRAELALVGEAAVDGAVRLKIKGKGLEDARLAACILRELGRARVPRRRTATTFQLKVKVDPTLAELYSGSPGSLAALIGDSSTKDSPPLPSGSLAVSPGGPQVLQRRPVVRGGLPATAVGRIVARHRREVGSCYKRALKRRPRLSCELVVLFAVTHAGQVTRPSVRRSTCKSKPLEACVVAAMGRWRFPRSKGGGVTIVSQGLVLRPGKR